MSNNRKYQHQRRETEPQNRDELLTLADVGRQIGKTRATISNWVRDGLLEAVRLPSGLPAVRRSEVNKLLANSALKSRVA